MLLVHRKREHARIGLEDECGAVAVVDVQIDDGDALDAVRLQHADRHRDIVERTEAFAVIREGVVQSAADDELRQLRILSILNASKPHAILRGFDGAADHRPESFDHGRRPRQLELRELFGRHRAISHPGQVLGGVHESELVPGRRLRFNEIRGPHQARLEEPGVHETVFVGGKHMRPDIDVISGRIDDQLRGAAT